MIEETKYQYKVFVKEIMLYRAIEYPIFFVWHYIKDNKDFTEVTVHAVDAFSAVVELVDYGYTPVQILPARHSSIND